MGENKKNKARNSFMHNGGCKGYIKLKGIAYYHAGDRRRNKRIDAEEWSD